VQSGRCDAQAWGKGAAGLMIRLGALFIVALTLASVYVN
jgi:hypothetical protein